MMEFEQALSAILKNTSVMSAGKKPIEESVGYVLAEDVYSKVAMPPFNKSAMDGFAVNVLDIKKIPVKLKCVGIVQAGRSFRKKIKRGECVKIMTGAPVPEGANGVVMVENTRCSENSVEILRAIKNKTNICFKGEDIKVRQKVMDKGTGISISDVALLASCGRRYVKVIRFPRVAFFNTGSEIVPLGNKLGEYKIYNSNGPQICSLLRSDGVISHSLPVVKDELPAIVNAVKKALKYDILLISGGVSAGDYDFVPEALKEAGVEKIFHKVKIKPGKPLFFGKYKKTIVFGIPGNPVSNFSTYILFVRSAIYKMMGCGVHVPEFKEGIIEEKFQSKPGRTHFVPVKIKKKKKEYHIFLLNSRGSADIFSLSKADAFMEVRSDVSVVEKNSKVKFITWKKM